MRHIAVSLLLSTALLVLPAMAQRGMSGGHGMGGHGFGGHTGAGRGGFAGGAPGPRGFTPHQGIIIRHPGAGVFIGTGPFPHGHFHHGHVHPFFPGSFCAGNPFACQGGLGFNPFFTSWWSGWPGYTYSLPYTVSDSSTYTDQVQATLAQQQQMIADLEEQVRQERLNRMQADSEQPSAIPSRAPPSASKEPITPTILVFRDKHRVEVRNYAIVGDTLYEFAPQWTRKMSLADLDLPATVQANEERGVKFRVPSAQSQVVTRP